jgi:hypothetical protein
VQSPFPCPIMALELQPPDGRKRVKVYELRENDWFDRGTGFCTGHISGVSLKLSSIPSPLRQAHSSPVAPAVRSRDSFSPGRAMSRISRKSANPATRHSRLVGNWANHISVLFFGLNRRYREYMSNPKMNRIASCSRPRSPRTMAIKNSKVSVPPYPPGGFTNEKRHLD